MNVCSVWRHSKDNWIYQTVFRHCSERHWCDRKVDRNHKLLFKSDVYLACEQVHLSLCSFTFVCDCVWWDFRHARFGFRCSFAYLLSTIFLTEGDGRTRASLLFVFRYFSLLCAIRRPRKLSNLSKMNMLKTNPPLPVVPVSRYHFGLWHGFQNRDYVYNSNRTV